MIEGFRTRIPRISQISIESQREIGRMIKDKCSKNGDEGMVRFVLTGHIVM